jgi:transcriptional regulator GlxA family with amidase domain
MPKVHRRPVRNAKKLSALARGRQPIRVAVLVNQSTDLIDFAAPWEVFAQTYFIDGKHHFRIYTVAASRKPLTLSGGLVVVPDYTLANAPSPDIVLVPALGRGGGPQIVEWIRRAHRRGTVIASVCLGAAELVEAGILDGLRATTHHLALDALRKAHPAVHFVGGVRFIKSSDTVYTAGGLTSGTDLALHLVRRILGLNAARTVAEQLEYEGTRWESGGTRTRALTRTTGAP